MPMLLQRLCARLRLARLIHIGDRNTFKQWRMKPRGQMREAGWSRFTHTAAWGRSLPLSFGKSFTSGCSQFLLTARGWNLAGRWSEEISERAAAAWLGMTAQECAVKRCGGRATFTQKRNRSDPRLDRAGFESCRLLWGRRIVCRLLLKSINKDELVYNLGRQSLDSVHPRHLLRTGKDFAWK